MQAAIERLDLSLHGCTVLTEAASGAYSVTAVLAAMAGADRVFAFTRTTRYGTAEQIAEATRRLAELSGARHPIHVITGDYREAAAQADIVTNSGHLRPIGAETVARMKPDAVIPLMFERWEYRPEDLDLEACRRRGILVAGTNERHPAVDVFSYLGILAAKQLMDAGVSVIGSRILVLCDNPFHPYLESGLRGAGACVDCVAALARAARYNRYDAIVVSLDPRTECGLPASDARLIAESWPGAVVTQFTGNLDRDALVAAGVPLWPAQAPSHGHMGILLSDIGPESIIRLQAGGLKVGEVLWRMHRGWRDSPWSELVQPLE